MKKYFYLFMCAVMGCTAITFTSCSNEEEITFPIEEELAGNYKGELKVNVDGTDVGTQTQRISVEKSSETSINLSLKNFSFIGLNIGDIEIKDCPLSQEGDIYSFTGTTTLDVAPLKAEVQAKGTIGAEKVEVNMDIAADLGGQKQSVKVVYKGEKLKGTEKTEAKIVSFIIDSQSIIDQPVINEDNTIKFNVEKDADISALIPQITISEGATVTPESGEPQDFSNGKVITYTVVSEDLSTTNVYKVSVANVQQVYKYDFEEWKVEEIKDWDGNVTWSYEIPSVGGWTGADLALNMVSIMAPDFDRNLRTLKSTDDAYSGAKAAMISTVDTKGAEGIFGFPAVPKVTSGSMFLGSFEVDVKNTLRSTRFGIEYSNKPIKVRGNYKYISGKDYYRCDDISKSNEAELDNSLKDECAISAVLYEVSSYDFPSNPQDESDERLNGTNIFTSDRIVAIAQMTSGEKSEFTPFELELAYKQEYSAEKLYRFAIICSSSKNGDKFSGAPGSTLIVDDISVIVE